MSTIKPLSRRQFLQLSGVVGTSALLAACAPAAAPANPTPSAGSGASTGTQAPQSIPELLGADMPGSPGHAKGWTTVLPDLPAGLPPEPDREPIVISTTRRVDAQTKFAGGDSLENNPWSRMIEKLFGVQFSVAWTWSTDDEANSKYNLSMASGDLPDYLETVPPTVFVKMVEANMLEDITDAYEMYASQMWKDSWAEYGDRPWTYSKVNGRAYGLPRVEDLAHNDNVFWYREDWFDELGLEVPTTLDELYATAKAIVDSDIGMGAPGTTIGLMANKQYWYTWYGSLDPIWGGYGIMPDHWSKEGDGLKFDSIRPEMKEPLALLNQWYNEGIFRADFFTMETSNAIQDIAAGQCGMHFTPSWGANLDAVKNDPNTRWAFADIPAGPMGAHKHTENNFRESPFCFRKGAENIDKVFEVSNWMQELTEQYDHRFHGWEGHNYEWQGDEVLSTGIGWMPWAPGPIGTRGSGMIDPKHIGNEIRYQLEEWGAIPEADRDAMMNLQLSDPTGVNILGKQSRLFILETADRGMITEFQSLPTPTMVERWADLVKLQDEVFLGTIIGERAVSDFDAFIEQWNSQGGDKVTAEVNEWWASRA